MGPGRSLGVHFQAQAQVVHRVRMFQRLCLINRALGKQPEQRTIKGLHSRF